MSMPPHQARRVAESFGADAERYNRTRPRYPAALIDRIAAAGRDVLDVGSGTGIVARQLRAAGCRVVGVEPDERMAAFGRRRGVPAEVAKFEDWHPEGREFDVVVAGQAWHWVDPVAGAAKAAQVLRPGGLLVVFWNVFVPPPALATAFGEVYGRVVPEMPNLGATPPIEPYTRMAATAADGMGDGFAAPEEWRFEWERSYTRDEWLDQVPTFGGHSLLTVDQLRPLLAGIGTAIDAAGGRFAMRYTTLAVAAVRS
jgi:SAM-dependent methyltransferase